MASQEIRPITVGIAGLGRSGWGIHARAFANLPDHYRVVAVCDPDTTRQEEARERFDCLAYDDFDSLIADKGVEFVVVATPSHLHAPNAVAALQAGKHVMVEKPMADSLAGVDAMISAARESGNLLTVNQNRRYSVDFLKVKEVIDSGILGEIVQIRISVSRFARRWDWQTLKKYGGGDLNNTGAHFVDMAMLLIDDPEPEVFCHMRNTPLYAGDAESHIKIFLKPKTGPVVDLEITNVCAYPQETWLVMGTQGGLSGGGSSIRWKYFDPAEAPPLVLDETPTPDRSYNRETLPWREESVELVHDGAGDVLRLYRSLYDTLREGAAPAITPESVRRQIAVLERCRALSPV
jgi:predicted dehydrogenase